MDLKEFSTKSVDEKLAAIFNSVEKTRKYFLWTLIGTIVVFVVPLLIMLVASPYIVSVYTSGLNF
jgi:hypothetical protein